MNESNFPVTGQHFCVTHADGKDRSYRDDVWQCLASDDHRIVAKPIKQCWYKEGHVFYRPDWIIQPVSDAVVAAVQVAEELRVQERAKQS